ncbi:hypothetical protein LMG18101_03811 [Ralstonia flaminis]|jgi:hypothetical protein|uniref:Uncharacterized protein n=1 Tax=Ralstonia flaminis TaxID=3058597 RepID=A0ABM9K9Q7_9RALS|nr:hypothetical protein LMG18101_03811 [Ralstonia sp. LMG 18101]
MCRMTCQQHTALGQFEFTELETRRDRAANQRVTVRTGHTLGSKLPARRHHRLVHRHLVLGHLAQAMRAHRTVVFQHMHV